MNTKKSVLIIALATASISQGSPINSELPTAIAGAKGAGETSCEEIQNDPERIVYVNPEDFSEDDLYPLSKSINNYLARQVPVIVETRSFGFEKLYKLINMPSLKDIDDAAILTMQCGLVKASSVNLESVNSSGVPIERITHSSLIRPKTYIFHDVAYTEDEWSSFEKVARPMSIIGLNDTMYAFDNPTDTLNFEKNELPILSSKLEAELQAKAQSKNLIDTSTAKFSVKFYDGINYAFPQAKYFITQVLERHMTWLGAEIRNDEYKQNLDAFIDKKVSSYKVEYEQVPRFKSLSSGPVSYVNLVMTSSFYLNKLEEDKARVFRKRYHKAGDTSVDSDLRDNHWLNIPSAWNWNDRIRAFEIGFCC